ncbi:MAG: NTP transferase domain-containing protein, partial [Planctomycetes bacterium]|nr:NTP transferase domain-containing protein [Planctomycetota bacterium]
LEDPRPLVVTGADHDAIARAAPSGVEVCLNGGWSAGRTGSVQRAAALRPGRDLCLVPVDVPLVPALVFAALRAEWEEKGLPERGWLAPFILEADARRFGHPVIVGRELAAVLKAFPPQRPLHALRAHACPLLGLAVRSASVLDDLDTPADLLRLRARPT